MATVMDLARLDAFADGALSPEEAAAVVLHLADHPEDQSRIDALLELNLLLAAAYAAPMEEPVPERIRTAIAPDSAESRVIPFRSRLPRVAPMLGGALAATVALTVGFSLGSGPDDGGQVAGPVDPDAALTLALETHASGEVPGVDGEQAITLIATFLDRYGRPCREFELMHQVERSLTRGIACRGAETSWTVAFALSERLAPPGLMQSFIPAQGAASGALTDALDGLGAGLGLTPAEEEALIANGWVF